MSPSEGKRDAVEAAARPMRERRRAEAGQLAEAERALRRADREHDRALRKARRRPRSSSPSSEREPSLAGGTDAVGERSRAIAETRTLLGSLGDLLDEDEDVLDMAAGINAGHDGVLVVTARRLIFVAPRRMLSFRHEDIARVEMKGRRWLGTRIAVSSPEGKATFSGIRQSHASELAELLDERSAVSAR